MKTRFTVLLLLFLFETAAVFAQSIVSFDMIQRNRNINVKLTLKDDSTSEPLSWATVYLIPAGDTTRETPCWKKSLSANTNLRLK